ncbi:MAG: hypothetical protein GTO63_15505 [Anaerolineae bacterium]|nr:hypothetical protein [Anaerolineae bacterium]NIN96234.1 hypothetical protein [Anaerolineae bacterium]NIQ79255.1 hypothetical protein [Anaerolineae bacterium]
MLPETPTQETKATKRSESYSRFVDGNRCRWRRLLGYYYNGRGITGPDSIDLLVGKSVHKMLETVLKASPDPADPKLLASILDGHHQAVTRMISADESLTLQADESVAMVETLAAAWTRITLPWVLDKFEILAVECPEEIEVTDPEGGFVTFRSRADFIAREKASGLISIHDFKTVSYWDDDTAELWHYNIQMYATAYSVQQRLGTHVPHYYIHPLLKGNRRYPSPLCKPWVAPAVTPLGKPTFSLTWKKNLERDWAYKYMPVQQFIDSLPPDKMTKFVPVAGPYGTDEEMARDFLSGAVTENRWWYDNLDKVDWDKWADPDHHAELVRTFPRSYACWDFKKLCPYHRICFRQKGWQEPLTFGYKTRTFDK